MPLKKEVVFEVQSTTEEGSGVEEEAYLDELDPHISDCEPQTTPIVKPLF